MTAMLTGALTAKIAQALVEFDWLTEPTRIETVKPSGLVTFRLASGMLVTVTVQVVQA
jgi:hypothetical protein